MRKRQNLIPQAQQAILKNNIQEIGRLINRAKNRIEKGILLSMLAGEYALRKTPNPEHTKVALMVLNMGRTCLTDEYHLLKSCKIQERLIRRILVDGDTDFAKMVKKERDSRKNK